ncbi:MAG: helix-turn-helix domain-containing protein [Bradymonadaceae bacterium]
MRELQNAVRHGVALAMGPTVALEDLPDEVRQHGDARGGSGAEPADMRSLEDVEREHIERVLAACDGSQAEAARVLEIGRTTLWRKLSRYGEP